MDKVQSVPEAETQKKEFEMQPQESRKRKRETQVVGYAIKGYWIKEKKKIKVNRLEKEITVVKELVFSVDEPLSEDQSITKDTWGFVRFQLPWTFYKSKRRHLSPIF